MEKRSYTWIWLVLFLCDGAGGVAVYKNHLSDTPQGTLAWGGYVILILVTTSLVAAPLIRFLENGWFARYEEFRNRLNNGALVFYLRQFWQPRTDKNRVLRIWPIPEDADAKKAADQAADALFTNIYEENYGRNVFLIPMTLVLISVFVGATLYIAGAFGVLNFNPYVNTNVALASLAGAYLFVISDLVVSVRRRTLNVADVYWYALRMVLAIPIGMAISAAAADTFPNVQATTAFAVSTFPMDVLFKVLRRLAARSLNNEKEQESDQLIQLEGVTANIAAVLSAEGVDSIDQLIGMDPVLLSIRTGFSFKFILRLGAQAIVWRHFGASAHNLVPLGLADAPAIESLMNAFVQPPPQQPPPQLPQPPDLSPAAANAVLANAAAYLHDQDPNHPALDVETLKFSFVEITKESYTKFLLATQKTG